MFNLTLCLFFLFFATVRIIGYKASLPAIFAILNFAQIIIQ